MGILIDFLASLSHFRLQVASKFMPVSSLIIGEFSLCYIYLMQSSVNMCVNKLDSHAI